MYSNQQSISVEDCMWDDQLDTSAQSIQTTSSSIDPRESYDSSQNNWHGNNRVFTRKNNYDSDYNQRDNSSRGRNGDLGRGNRQQNWRDNETSYDGYRNQSGRNFDRSDRNQFGRWSDGQGEKQYNRRPDDQGNRPFNRRSEDQGERQFNRRSEDQGERQFNRRSDDQNDRTSDESTLKFFINASQVGRVIGRRGAKINEFVEQSGARIKVDSNAAQQQQEEVEVVVRGNQDCCQKAKDLIEEFINNFSDMQIRDNSRNYNYNSNADNTSDNSFSSVQESPASQPDPSVPFDWDYFKHLAVEHERAKFAGLPVIKKDFYEEHPQVATCPKEEVKRIRAERNNITVTKAVDNTSEIPNPVWTFEHAYKNHPEILRELKKQGFTGPSPIQCQAWPVLLSGHDMIGIAQTGTGKTIAFLLPAFIHIEHQITPRAKRGGPSCLVLAPTRELALQIHEEALKYSYRNIKCVCVYGGGSRRDQIKVVTKGVEIVIATPGRLVDLIRSEIIQLKGVSYMVLDEADRMLDMGFEPDVKYIMSFIRPDRQMVLTSATWPDGVARLVNKYMTHPMTVNVGCLDLAAVHTVEQQFYFITDHHQKRQLVFDFIASMQPEDKVLIFVDKKAVVDDVASDIQLNNIHCASLHGDRCQEDREQALFEFKESHTRILVATDLASRGLDVKDVTHVFNMCMPKNLEDYVHRIGRTGRAGRNGTAISIIDRADWGISRKLIGILEESGNYVPQELVSMAERYEKKKMEQQLAGGGGGGGRSGFHRRY